MIFLRRRALSFVATLAVGGMTASAAVAQTTPTKDERASKRRVLKPADLVYEGSFAPPKSAEGKSTSYANMGLAMRMVDGQRRFFSGVGPDDSGIYEMNFPGLSRITADDKSWPSARVLKWWGDITQGKCLVANKQNAIVKHGLFWDEPAQRLYWTYGSGYNAAGANDPCVGWSDLSGPKPVAHGPFRVSGGAASAADRSTRAVSASCRGGVLRLPEWFAKEHARNRSLGIGFGGYYNIISAGVSMGPALFAVEEPTDATKDLPALPCVAHTFTKPGIHYARRSATYSVPKDGWPGIAPVKGTGFWTAMDTIQAACCWVDVPEVSGLIFMPWITKGPVSYEVMNNRAPGGGADNWLYVYDPADLALVASGKKLPWDIAPVSMTEFPTPLGGRVNGLVWDKDNRTLFVLAVHAYRDGVETYALVHAYRVK